MTWTTIDYKGYTIENCENNNSSWSISDAPFPLVIYQPMTDGSRVNIGGAWSIEHALDAIEERLNERPVVFAGTAPEDRTKVKRNTAFDKWKAEREADPTPEYTLTVTVTGLVNQADAELIELLLLDTFMDKGGSAAEQAAVVSAITGEGREDE